MDVKNKKVFIRTFGCQMNVADSERMAGILADAGYNIISKEDSADIVLLNTCCVRKLPEEKVWSKLGQLHNQRNGKVILGVVGCMAQEYGEKIFNRAPYVNLVCGTYRFHRIDELLKRVSDEKRIVSIECVEDDLEDGVFARRNSSICAFVPISRGCNNSCSYCVVPYVRGTERNRHLDDIISEVRGLADAGYKEVTLLGQNVNSYRSRNQKPETRNQKPIFKFVDLLEEVNKIHGIERIRFVTSHPKDASLDLFKAIGELDKICEYLHLPVQSGSNKILEKMNRGYTREHYIDLIKKLRKYVPGVAISTDIIVGFSGETEEDFQDTYNLMKEVGFDSAFVFKYSPRPGTDAAKYKDDVPIDVKRERNHCILKLQDDISLKKNKLLAGNALEVLVEGISKNNKNRIMGRTRTNKIVVFETTDPPRRTDLVGRLINIKIIEASPHTLFGRLV